ncbi:FGGY-family carbohydrate kinase [Roseinatronobacter alkalisoli]|uniref:FGGY-family carbohydrate kinase n=1 Tax=Roseinatronobacter alkalisoli TaxID=3028235 RepID=A0ABT5T562_9RHOB|nr:FGGY-family carbohydrate kinase [Roseinatronobacter sp. HJB301]MDD7970260.1 FGGY-family carbohydrate kinase [Roseinatronobacter sp. HJB301]
MTYFLGVDVGTGSARAGVFDASGRLLGTAAQAITTHRPRAGFAQQSSARIWASVAAAVRDAVARADVDAGDIRGIGFDATCSLVVNTAQGGPVSVDPDGAPDQDVILWMDHRALGDADAINAIGGAPLQYVGGTISPEMELPKLRWLKRELPQAWAAAGAFFDLPDWLVHRATGSATRSLCSMVCKWTYLGHMGQHGEGWDDAFLAAIGLEDLTLDNHARIGTTLAAPGQPCGGLTDAAAQELGLRPGTPVAASLIDAHAGALGTLGVGLDAGTALDGRLAVIAGTSTCHIALTPEPVFVPGIWGPYFGVVTGNLWALEGGQSAAGALLDSVIARHAAADALTERAQAQGCRITDLIDAHLAQMGDETATLTHARHVQPDFHGNRSPRAEPWRKGGTAGLTLDTGIDDLALDYLASVQALAYGTRHILQVMRDQGVAIDTLVVSGGLARNALYLREHADATGCKVVVPDQEEPVLLGCAMLGAVAAGAQPDLPAAMPQMSGGAQIIAPRGGDIAAYHDRKFTVMQRMQDDYAAYVALMKKD